MGFFDFLCSHVFVQLKGCPDWNDHLHDREQILFERLSLRFGFEFIRKFEIEGGTLCVYFRGGCFSKVLLSDVKLNDGTTLGVLMDNDGAEFQVVLNALNSRCDGGCEMVLPEHSEDWTLEHLKYAIDELRTSDWENDVVFNIEEGSEYMESFSRDGRYSLLCNTGAALVRYLENGGNGVADGDVAFMRALLRLKASDNRFCSRDQVALFCWCLARLGERKSHVWANNAIVEWVERGGSDEFVKELVKKTYFDGEDSVVKNTEKRKVVYFDTCWASPSKIDNLDDGVVVMTPKVLELYNANVEDSGKLIFQPGHPQKGCTYLQHPLKKNIYYEVNTFHNSLRERKQAELLRILESIGAYEATVMVSHEQSEDREFATHEECDVRGSVKAVNGAFAASGDSDSKTMSSMSQKSKMSWKFNPPDKPGLPEDLCFYPTEETWQQLVKSVLRGGLKTAVVDLEYRNEYGITTSYLSKLSNELKTVFASYNMNLSESFSQKLHQLTTTVWHYDVVFENEKGRRAGVGCGEVVSSPVAGKAGVENRGEVLFMKRVRRYVSAGGDINAEQRADLGQLAVKCGIDELRMEELIESAFE